jgi:chaperonin GroEL
LLEKVAQTRKKELVIIADDVEGEAMTTFVINKLRGGFNVLAIKAPGYGDRKKDMLADIATVIGAKLVSEELGVKLESAEMNVLGKANRVVATKDNTIIVGGKGKKTEIDARVAALKKQKEITESKFDIEKIEERIAKLSGGVAVIKVGAATETEMKYLKLKIEDAVSATKAAIAEGVVAGGGSALARVAKKIKNSKTASSGSREFEIGYQIVVKALESPLKQIVVNAGKSDGSVIVDRVMNSEKENFGYNASEDADVEDMIKAGIIDPVKVTRTALQNAASAAAILLTTEAAIADEPKEEKVGGGMPGGMPDMGY